MNTTNLIAGELEVISNHINDGDMIFDVGAYHGEWTSAVLDRKKNCYVHVFEPLPSSFTELRKRLSSRHENIVFNNLCVSDSKGLAYLWEYNKNVAFLSTVYKRSDFELSRQGISQSSKMIEVSKIALDDYCKEMNVQYIDFLKIDSEGSEFDILKGADTLLSGNKIKFIQFEYGGCFKDANITLENIFYFLKEKGYSIGRITEQGVKIIHQFLPDMENYDYCNYLGILHNEDILY